MEYVSLNSNSLASNLPPDTPKQSKRATTALPGHPGSLTALQALDRHSLLIPLSRHYASPPSRPLPPRRCVVARHPRPHPFRVRLDPLARLPRDHLLSSQTQLLWLQPTPLNHYLSQQRTHPQATVVLIAVPAAPELMVAIHPGDCTAPRS